MGHRSFRPLGHRNYRPLGHRRLVFSNRYRRLIAQQVQLILFFWVLRVMKREEMKKKLCFKYDCHDF